jgi:hypothetical protein
MLGFPVFSSAVNGIEMRKTEKRTVTGQRPSVRGMFPGGATWGTALSTSLRSSKTSHMAS